MIMESISFDTLPISTQTVMVYFNCTFDPEYIYENLEVSDKYKNVNLKDIPNSEFEHGIVYLLKTSGGKSKGMNTTKGHFRNQITAKIFIIDKLITIKIFRTGKFHMTGCKNSEHINQGCVYLFDCIRKLGEKAWKPERSEGSSETNVVINCQDSGVRKANTESSSSENIPIKAITEIVMVNVDFKLGFKIDQSTLDSLVQKNGGQDFYSTYESTLNPSVNIKMEFQEPEKKVYDCLTIHPRKPKFTLEKVTECPKAKPKKIRTHTFLVFSSSKVIQSGRWYNTQMEPAFNRFNDFIKKYKSQIQMNETETKFDLSSLKSINN